MKNLLCKPNYSSDQSGFATLLIVWMIVLGASIILISTLSSRTLRYSTFDAQKNSKIAQGLARSCTEAALLEIKNNTAYTGTQVLAIAGNSCSFSVVNGGSGNLKTITSTSTVVQAKRSTVTNLTALSPSLVVGSFAEQ
jgi:hypothetical protein